MAIRTLAATLCACALFGGAANAQEPQPSSPATPATSDAVLWKDPGDIAARDLFWGAGSDARKPAPPFTFLKEDLSGSKPKVRVIDANGVTWNVKFAGDVKGKNEVQAEVAANRILWALGFPVEEDYFIESGTIENVGRLERARSSIDRNGAFRTARFERRDTNVTRDDRMWSVDKNPFLGTKELSGLKIALALINSWDNKPDNTVIEVATTPDGRSEERYLFSDLGATFGRMAGPPDWSPAPTRWSVADYRAQPLIAGVRGDEVQLHYIGQVPMPSVPLEHARWFAELAGRLTLEQVRKAFEAAGATAQEADGFAARLIEKIDELRSAVGATRQ